MLPVENKSPESDLTAFKGRQQQQQRVTDLQPIPHSPTNPSLSSSFRVFCQQIHSQDIPSHPSISPLTIPTDRPSSQQQQQLRISHTNEWLNVDQQFPFEWKFLIHSGASLNERGIPGIDIVVLYSFLCQSQTTMTLPTNLFPTSRLLRRR